MTDVGWIEIYQDRMWFGDPRMATFSVYIDKEPAGRVPLQSSIIVPLTPGTHRVRVRQWYYGSRALEVSIRSGEKARYRADVPRKLGFRGYARMLYNPARCLTLEPREAGAPAQVTPFGSHSAALTAGGQEIRRSQMLGGLIASVGFVLLLVGLHVTTALTIVGAVVVVAGLVWNVRAFSKARRVSREVDNGT